ncbi:NACHT domain-containing NTPase [Vitiosangium sp. GDMCC 1.1324]|uniref:NACHT domain-containing protein n=1 Tax=Vitiosangium sp. (strain GDMCC 1.1324) TaxID=2138576 RepID=UPI000D3B62B4|nr:restriction endonuclease [Vitiosangium sp. GDMCC 1.1324]PTL75434.1 hypothetical protein DAT35_54955 [Vitiosangium sp. GDMCC 1.1324]
MTLEIPRPKEWTELEHLVLRLARDLLKDPHASYYGTQGHGQHGLDVMAEDRRPDGTGKRWVFQAKNYLKTKLQPSHLEKLKTLLLKYPHRESIDTFVVVTTSTVSPSVHDAAKELSERLRLTFRVWSWEVFSELLRTHCGAGPWLSQAERVALRERYCCWAAEQMRRARPLYPLDLRTMVPRDVRLEEVLVQRTLRLLPRQGEPHAKSPTGGRSAARGGEGGARPTSGEASKDPGGAPGLFEGTLVEWLKPGDNSRKPMVLMLAAMGTGKTVALLQAEAQLAAAARAKLTAPLPLRLRAAELVGGRIEDLLRRSSFRELDRLWADPLCEWVLLVDGLDELDGYSQQEVLQALSALRDTNNVRAVAVSCRASHDRPGLLPEAVRVELPPWSGDEAEAFLLRWEQTSQGGKLHEDVRALLASDVSLRANALCTTLLLLRAPKDEAPPEGRAWLFQPLVDDLFRKWAEARTTRDGNASGKDTSGWVELQHAFEQVALEGLEQGGFPLSRRVLESALARAQGDDMGVERALESAYQIGLVRLTEGGKWNMPLRAIAEYLAAGALRHVSDEDFTRACGQPWAGEVARLALDRRRHRPSAQNRSLRPLLQRLLKPHEGDSDEHLLRRTLVVLHSARDLGLTAADVPDLPGHLRRLLRDETSAWRRRRLGAAVRELARKGGPLWGAVWQELEPLLLSQEKRAVWLARHECDDVNEWMARLLEQDVEVRVVAIKKLARWRLLPDVQEALLSQLLDTSRGLTPNTHGEPALAAAEVLRTAPRTEALLAKLRAHLEGNDAHLAEAAAVALLPGEAETDKLLSALKSLYRHLCRLPLVLPLARAAAESHRNNPEGRGWLEQHWPQVLTGDLEDWSKEFTSSEQPCDAPTPPPSQYVQRDVLWSIIPALRDRALLEQVQARPFVQQNIAEVYSAIAEMAPEAVVDLLRRDAHYFPWEEQESLGRATLQSPELGRALVERWDKKSDALPANFPGVALEPLAARGDAEAVRVYSQWLCEAVNMHRPFPHRDSNRPFPHRDSTAALRQPAVHEAARAVALSAWREAIHGKLGIAPLGAILLCLWPSWREEQEVTAGLVEWATGEDLEKVDAALLSWMEGELPPEVIRSLYERLRHTESWPTQAPFFWRFKLPRWLAAAARAGMLKELESVLRFLAEELEPKWENLWVRYQACAYLLRLHPEEAQDLAKCAASTWPWCWGDNEELSFEDVQRLVSAAPAVWAEACLAALAQWPHQVAWPFLVMAGHLCQWLPLRSTWREKLIASTRELAAMCWHWASVGFLGPYVRIDDEAKRLLFLLGEPVQLAPPEPQ